MRNAVMESYSRPRDGLEEGWASLSQHVLEVMEKLLTHILGFTGF